MDKELLKKIFLEYMFEQTKKGEIISAEALEEIAQSEDKAEIIMNELHSERLIEYSNMIMNKFKPGPQFKSFNNIELTDKGSEYIAKNYGLDSTQFKESLKGELFKEEVKEVLNSHSQLKDVLTGLAIGKTPEEILTKINVPSKKQEDLLVIEDIIKKAPKNLSIQEKYRHIKKDILVFFYELSLDPCLLFDDKGEPYNLYKARGQLKKIVLEYFKSSSSHLEYIINQFLYQENLTTYRYGKQYIKDNEEIGLKNFITEKGIKHLEDNYSYCPNKTLGELSDEEFTSTYRAIVPRLSSILPSLAIGTNPFNQIIAKQIDAIKNVSNAVGLNSSAFKLAQEYVNSPSFKALQDSHVALNVARKASNILPQVNSSIIVSANQMVKAVELANKPIQKPYTSEADNNKDNQNDNKGLFAFEGILGKNCGKVEKYIDSDKRLQEKDFIVSDGVRVLRGFAKASDLYFASKPEYNYQRPLKEGHLDNLESFLLNMKGAAKYIPEVTLVARNNYKLEKFILSDKALSPTKKGMIENLNYHTLNISENELLRIDGNHRIESAYKLYKEHNTELYIPFSIILWNSDDYIGDGSKTWKDMIDEEHQENEAFLFYFLNSKAKKLEIEENLKGIINASPKRWKDEDLKIANKNLALIRDFNEQIGSQVYLNSHLCNNEAIRQIAEILEKINSNIEKEEFSLIMQLMNELIIIDNSIKLKTFNFYCQLIFYIAYKNKTKEQCVKIINNLENWVKKNDFDNETFNDPILLYKNAEKTNNLNPINIFVAMPYNEKYINNFTSWINSAIKLIFEQKPQLQNRINLNPIMKHSYYIDIMDEIMLQIRECNVFIADISSEEKKVNEELIKYDANPNVMYELGIAHNLKKPIILMRNDDKYPKVPSDIQEKYRNTYEMDNANGTQEVFLNALKNILTDFYGITFE